MLSTHPDCRGDRGRAARRCGDGRGRGGGRRRPTWRAGRPRRTPRVRAARLGRHKLPEALHPIDALPLTAGEKVDRRALARVIAEPAAEPDSVRRHGARLRPGSGRPARLRAGVPRRRMPDRARPGRSSRPASPVAPRRPARSTTRWSSSGGPPSTVPESAGGLGPRRGRAGARRRGVRPGADPGPALRDDHPIRPDRGRAGHARPTRRAARAGRRRNGERGARRRRGSRARSTPPPPPWPRPRSPAAWCSAVASRRDRAGGRRARWSWWPARPARSARTASARSSSRPTPRWCGRSTPSDPSRLLARR